MRDAATRLFGRNGTSGRRRRLTTVSPWRSAAPGPAEACRWRRTRQPLSAGQPPCAFLRESLAVCNHLTAVHPQRTQAGAMVTLRSARLGRSPVSTASPGSIEEERHDPSETSRDSAAANPCGRGSPARRDGDPRGGHRIDSRGVSTRRRLPCGGGRAGPGAVRGQPRRVPAPLADHQASHHARPRAAALRRGVDGWAREGLVRRRVRVMVTPLVIASPAASGPTAGAQPEIPTPGPLAEPRPLRQVGAPADLTRAAIPPDNRQTPQKIALGEKLFFDGRLSADGTVACGTCHDPAPPFTDRKRVTAGVGGRAGQRNAPTILNALYNKTQFWDGRVTTLEEQAALPIVNPVEMGQPSLNAAVARIAAIREYQDAFQEVFGGRPNGPDLLRAIASYERTQLSFDSPFDHFIAGDASAIDGAAKRGWELFNTRGRCNKCHALTDAERDVTNFTDHDFHNIGIGIIRPTVVPP